MNIPIDYMRIFYFNISAKLIFSMNLLVYYQHFHEYLTELCTEVSLNSVNSRTEIVNENSNNVIVNKNVITNPNDNIHQSSFSYFRLQFQWIQWIRWIHWKVCKYLSEIYMNILVKCLGFVSLHEYLSEIYMDIIVKYLGFVSLLENSSWLSENILLQYQC